VPSRRTDKEDALTPEMVRELFLYDPVTGILKWSKPPRRGVAAGIAGCANADGYRIIGYRGEEYMAIHVIWCWMTGKWPTHGVDHKDRNPANDVWKNLREATYSQNNRNRIVRRDSSTGIKGVMLRRKTGAFTAYITINKRRIHIGDFRSIEGAAAARKETEMRLFGEFSPHHGELNG